MNIRLHLVAAAVAAGLAFPAAAESFASSASSASSASVGSLSESVGGSSDASTGQKTAAAGAYRILAIVPADGDRQTLQLQGTAEASRRLTLTLPVAAAALQVGDEIAVLERPYGLAFARATPAAEPFFVALDDAWMRDLDLRRVTL